MGLGAEANMIKKRPEIKRREKNTKEPLPKVCLHEIPFGLYIHFYNFSVPETILNWLNYFYKTDKVKKFIFVRDLPCRYKHVYKHLMFLWTILKAVS